MKKTILILSIVVSPFVAKSMDTTKVFNRNAIYSVSGAFTEVDNWNAGGENSSNVSFLLRENWINKGLNFTTVHLLEGNYGLSRQAGTLTKNADRLEFTTTLTGSSKTTEWNLSSQFNVRTQLAPGYAKGDTSGVPISNFGAPIYGQFSFGVGNNSYEHWQVFLSPLAGKSTTVLDADLRNKAAFGVDTGTTWRLEAGAKITLNYNQQFSEAFSVTAKSDIFYNYWGPISATDLNLDIIAIYKIRKALSFNAHFQLIRDIDQIDAWQRRSVLGVGLAYTIK
ncbi:DUF3078 domain-containing protein [Schleiferiaceae bacterium]|nr:DUF3078 domain-containing protein [Schleiferiaceae bacterium]